MKKYIKTLYIFAIIFMALSLVSCHNKSKDTELEQENDEYYESDEYEEEYEESSWDPIGNWRLVPIYNEFRERTDNMMARVDFYAQYLGEIPLDPKQVSILYIPNYGFEIHGYTGGVGGWMNMKIRDDDNDEITEIKYHSKYESSNKYHSKDDSYSTDYYIMIDNPDEVRKFYGLMLKGNLSLLLDNEYRCYINDQTRGLGLFLKKNNIDDKYTVGLEFEGIPIVEGIKMKELLEHNNYTYIGKDTNWDARYPYEELLFRGHVLGTQNVIVRLNINESDEGNIRFETKKREIYQKWVNALNSKYGPAVPTYSGADYVNYKWLFSTGDVIFAYWNYSVNPEEEKGNVVYKTGFYSL